MSSPLPSPVQLLQSSFDSFTANPMGYLAAGLVFLLVSLVMIIGSFVVSFVIPIALTVVLAGTVGYSSWGEAGVVVAMILGSILVFGCVALMTTPLYASVLRVLDADGPTALNVFTPFARMKPDPVRIMMAALAMVVLTFVGFFACVLPGVLLSFALFFAMPAVVLDRMSITDAAKLSWTLMSSDPAWRVPVWLIFGVGMAVLSQIPIVGIVIAVPLALDFQLRAYRAAFPA